MPVPVCPKCEYDTRGLPSDICPECGERLPDVAPPGAPKLAWRLALAAFIVVATLVVGYFTAMEQGGPVWWRPWPLSVVVPYFITRDEGLAMLPIFFIAALLTIPVILGQVQVPWATSVPVAALIALAWLHIDSNINRGLNYQGSTHVAICVSVQVAINVTLVALWIYNRRHPHYVHVVFWHMLASIWLASYAFPFYGGLA